MNWIKKSGLAEMLLGYLKNKVYVGISAGSIVTGNRIFMSKELYYREKDHPDEEICLRLVDFTIRPHLNNDYFPKVKKDVIEKMAQKIPETIYALDDESAIKYVDGKLEIISEGEWLKFN